MMMISEGGHMLPTASEKDAECDGEYKSLPGHSGGSARGRRRTSITANNAADDGGKSRVATSAVTRRGIDLRSDHLAWRARLGRPK